MSNGLHIINANDKVLISENDSGFFLVAKVNAVTNNNLYTRHLHEDRTYNADYSFKAKQTLSGNYGDAYTKYIYRDEIAIHTYDITLNLPLISDVKDVVLMPFVKPGIWEASVFHQPFAMCQFKIDKIATGKFKVTAVIIENIDSSEAAYSAGSKTTPTLYLFGEASVAQQHINPTDTHGLEVFDSTEKLIFSSNLKPLKVFEYMNHSLSHVNYYHRSDSYDLPLIPDFSTETDHFTDDGYFVHGDGSGNFDDYRAFPPVGLTDLKLTPRTKYPLDETDVLISVGVADVTFHNTPGHRGIVCERHNATRFQTNFYCSTYQRLIIPMIEFTSSGLVTTNKIAMTGIMTHQWEKYGSTIQQILSTFMQQDYVEAVFTANFQAIDPIKFSESPIVFDNSQASSYNRNNTQETVIIAKASDY